MRNLLTCTLSGLLLSACSDTPEKYRDIKHLELPPTLAIEHNTSTPIRSSSGVTSTSSTPNKAPSDLDKLIYLSGETTHPIITLKTRYERAWDLIDHGLTLADVEMVEKDREKGIFKVRFEDKAATRNLMQTMSSMFSISYADIEYTLTLDKDGGRTTPVHLEKIKESDPEENAAQTLANLLIETIKKDLAK